MRRVNIYKLAPVILAISGLVFGVFFYNLDRFMTIPHKRWILWGIVITFLTISGLLLGLLIKDLYYFAHKDPLTGLNNRRYFYDILTYEMNKLGRDKFILSLAIIDIDNFKNINDTYGHLEGDKVLQELSNIINNSVRTYDTVARWGGEEFAIILPQTDINGALVFAERIRKKVENHKFCCKVTISIGITSTKTLVNTDKFIDSADCALYKAKANKNKVESI